MKEFHILTVGNSLLSNYKRKHSDLQDVKMGDEEFWGRKLKDPSFFRSLLNFLRESPKDHSAEMNSLVSYAEYRGIKLQDISVYLTGTKTASNAIIQNVLMSYLKELEVEVLSPKEVEGLPLLAHEEEIAREFEKDLSNLLDTLLRLAKKKKEEGYKVVFNPTGGYKPHVITCAFAGFLTQSEIYYIHEELRQLIIIPPMFYFPREGEMKVLELLEEAKAPVRGKEFEKIMARYGKAIDRLSEYGLVEFETKPGEAPYGIKITPRGTWALDYYRKLTRLEVKVKE